MPRSNYDRAYKHLRFNYILRIITIFTGVCGFCLVTYALSQQEHVYTDGAGGLADVFFMAPLALSFVWSLAYVIAVLVKKTMAPMHPGIPVGFDLVTALSLANLGGFASALMITWGSCDLIKDEECAAMKRIMGTERTAQVLPFIDFVFHLMLFIFACMACHKERWLQKGDKANAYIIELQQTGFGVPKV